MTKPPIILPSETQNREFDAKLLLASALATQGYPVYVGSRMEIHKQIHRLPRGLYLAKDINKSSRRILRLVHQLGFAIAAWDEEAVSIADISTFQARRIAPENLALTKGFFAWGAQNREALVTHPDHAGQPIWITGNPRTDLLRPGLRAYFDAEAQALRKRFGDFILINSNFGRLNHFLEQERAHRLPDGRWMNIAQGTPDWWTYRAAVMDSIRRMLPALAARYPQRNIIIRPHPSESADLWDDLMAGYSNAYVIHQGAVHPWICASAVAIHNMCTTGIESYLLDHPVIAYQEVPSDGQRTSLANELSRSVTSQSQLFEMLDQIFADQAAPFQPSDQAVRQLEHEMGPLDGALASERIAEIVSDQIDDWMASATHRRVDWIKGNWGARLRKTSKQINSMRVGHKNSTAYTRSRWPGITLDEVRARLVSIQRLVKRSEIVTARSPMPDIFRLEQR